MFGKQKGKFFGNNIQIECKYCTKSSDYDGASVCKLGRYLEPDGSCRHFVYDPLKRTPLNVPPLKAHSEDEFKL